MAYGIAGTEKSECGTGRDGNGSTPEPRAHRARGAAVSNLQTWSRLLLLVETSRTSFQQKGALLRHKHLPLKERPERDSGYYFGQYLRADLLVSRALVNGFATALCLPDVDFNSPKMPIQTREAETYSLSLVGKFAKLGLTAKSSGSSLDTGRLILPYLGSMSAYGDLY